MEQRKVPYNNDENPDFPFLENQGWDAMRQMLDVHMPQKEEEKRRVVPMYWRWMAAAVLLLFVSVLSYEFFTKDAKHIDIPNTATNIKGKKANTDVSSNGNIASNNKLDKTENDNIKNTNKTSEKTVVSGNNKKQDELKSYSQSRNVALAQRDGQHSNVNQVLSNSNSSAQNDNSRANQILAYNQRLNVDRNSDIGTILSKQAAEKNSTNLSAILNKSNVSDATINQQKINLDVNGLNDNIASAKNKSINKENVEAFSGFRQRMNQALLEDAKSDSLKELEIAKTKKLQSDSQLVALRREQLAQYFEQKEKEEKSSNKMKPKVDLAVLVNRNMTDKNYSQSGNSLYTLPVYPAVNASVKVSQKIGFTTGISTAAPGNFTNTSVNSSSAVYSQFVNAAVQPSKSSDKVFLTASSMTSKEVALTSTSSSEVQQAFYWQIPLMMDYYIAQSKLKISAGTDFSIIQKVMVGNSYSSQLMNGDAYNNSGGLYRVKNFDPRLSVGAQYRINNFLLGARFSRSFQPAIQYNGVPTNGGNNQVFNFSIGYSFFK